MTNQKRNTANSAQYPESISQKVVVRIADRIGVRPTELPPLYDSIDPDALNAIVTRAGNDLEISFSFAEREVVVRGDRSVEVN